ncbi:MAG: LytTR family transcriptional regulator DNA-binding domain-containing protein [Prevotellaceae bacterium]|jgi:DNA-binding LytR/AlgR family response regulator|nr:LytTR family transcriptional regulator DNA-binding domain-containing protein [Prevotellaceae bacterium]
MFIPNIPAYIYEKRNSIRLILFTALIALIFTNLYKPFNSPNWYPGISDRSFMYFVFSSFIILTGMLVVVISRIILYYWGRKHDVRLFNYVLWILIELFFMALFYTFYTVYMNPERDYLNVFQESFVNTLLVVLLPYVVLHLYFAYKDKERQLQWLKEHRVEATPRQTISFYDEKGDLRLSVTREHLLYIEAADNYVNIWYLNKDTPTKLLLRNSLKTIEKYLENTQVIRCHRSYIVNLETVKVIRRQKDGIYMEFGIALVPDIPVSRKYDEKISRWFSTNAQ